MKTAIDMEFSQRVVDVLNNALETDRRAINNLFACRVHCNEALAHHPTIQVNGQMHDGKFLQGDLGIMGLINGLVGIHENDGPKKGWGGVAAHYDDDRQITHFSLVENP